jgi:formylglycine-generating enzyme required for sulfatase activity
MRQKRSTVGLLIVLYATIFCATPAKAKCQASFPAQSESIENSVGMRLVKIMPGEFLMGSPESEPDRFECERQHKVRITNAFWIGVEEVTIDQYSAVLNREPNIALDGNQPERYLSWHDAEAFCRKLSELPPEKMFGRSYRLPTEAEWEYACRAETQTVFFWGEDPNAAADYTWNLKNSSVLQKRAGSRKPNPWGLHDMNGGLWEWCSDWYAELPSEEQTDPQGPLSGEQRVVRGGAFDSPVSYIRSASRAPANPSFLRANEGQNIGFRVVMVELETKETDSDRK